MIPGFRKDGYLPDGIHLAELDEIANCFGTTQQRSKLMSRVRTWVGLARSIRARRLLLAGSFVTSKPDPTDVDAVVLLPDDFSELVDQGIHDALELSTMIISRHPEEIFAAEDERDWYNWVDFFSRTRELDGRSKGIIEVKL